LRAWREVDHENLGAAVARHGNRPDIEVGDLEKRQPTGFIALAGEGWPAADRRVAAAGEYSG
jgi:hypothetical protein